MKTATWNSFYVTLIPVILQAACALAITRSILGLAPTGPAQALFKTASRFVRQLELFRVYTKRDYRDGLPDKAEWGQGIIATFESGFTQGPVGFGVDCIAQYAVRLDGGRGPSGRRLD